MAFKEGRAKTGGRQIGTRNKVNLFNQETVERAKAVIAEQVALGDVEACKLVLSYSMSKAASHKVGTIAELEAVKNESEIKRITKRDKKAEFFDI
jgi:AmiR/NasT family two-component response regulator